MFRVVRCGIGDSDFQLKSIRCLSSLLIHNKTKRPDGDIPFVIKFVKVSSYSYIYTC